MWSFFDSPFTFIWVMLTSFRYDRFRPRNFDPSKDMQDLQGKVAIITGGSAGIGYGTAKHLARQGAIVYIASRNESRAMEAIKNLEATGLGPGSGKLRFLKLDLEDPRSARGAAEEFQLKENRLDILVNNAALLISHPARYLNGVLDYMVVNHISPFLFTTTLLPLMKITAKEVGSDVRIINVSSDAMLHAPSSISFKDVEDFNTSYDNTDLPWYGRYCATKLANVLFAKELQKRFDREDIPITAISLHPGNVDTFADSTPYPRLAKFIMKLIFMPPDVGAYTSAFAAAAPCVKSDAVYKGAYLQPVAQLGIGSETSCDGVLARELWETTERLLDRYK